MCQQRIAEIVLYQGQTSTAVVKDRTLFIQPERHVDRDGDGAQGTRRDEGLDKLRRIIEKQGDTVTVYDSEGS
jgi:hypothetical protein